MILKRYVFIVLGLMVAAGASAYDFEHPMDAFEYRHMRHKHQSEMAVGNPGISHLALNNAQATVAFSPEGGGEQIITDAINHAQHQILVQAYGFSNKQILDALAQAKARGVDVRVILDKSNDRGKYSGATYVANAGIPVWIDFKPTIAHNKVMIIDGKEVITGSFNFTEAAQKHNAENVLVLDNAPQLAGVYAKNWQWRLGESRQYMQTQ
jgi:phosphatidylserine/phosphatidylglycerophosphate/cardiolipin synthase-like enzyme